MRTIGESIRAIVPRDNQSNVPVEYCVIFALSPFSSAFRDLPGLLSSCLFSGRGHPSGSPQCHKAAELGSGKAITNGTIASAKLLWLPIPALPALLLQPPTSCQRRSG